MPKATYTSKKGLVQAAGTGVRSQDGSLNFLPCNYKYITATGNYDYSGLEAGKWVIIVNVAMADGKYIRLPEATTSNGGMHIRVIIGIAPADDLEIGFVTSKIVGGATTLSDNAVGLMTANAAYVVSAVGTSNLRVNLDVDAAAGDGMGAPGTVLDFFYPGVANLVFYRGTGLGSKDSVTLANHFSTTAVNA